MGNVLHTQRLVRAARLNSDDGNENVSSILQLVEQRPALLRAKSGALEGTLWHWAATNGNALLLAGLIRLITRTTSAPQEELCQLLNQVYNLDTTPLMLACQHGHTDAVCTLLQHGADSQLSDRRGNNTCLHIAASAGHASVIKVVLDTPATYPLLREAGVADVPGIHHHHQQQQQQQSLAGQQEQSATLLLDKGNLYGLTALHMAVCMGHAEAARSLLEAGASLIHSSKYPVQFGRLYLPHRTTPLHAAVQARDLQCVAMLLTVHEQRYGGTAAGRASDPRWMLNGNEQSPYQLAHSMQLPGSVCELLYPLTPLRERLQQWQPQQGMPMEERLCHSLQELAGVALREALLSQLHCVAAAVGAGGCNADQQQEQKQPEAIDSAAALHAAAAELFLKLQNSAMVCVSITHAERLCMQLAAQHDSQLIATTGAQQMPCVSQLSKQSLLDVVRFYILCHGVCDPGDPSSCWFADACNICRAVACSAVGTGPGKQPGSSLLPSSNTQCGQTSESQAFQNPGKVLPTDCDGRPCSSSSNTTDSCSPVAPQRDDDHNSGCINRTTPADCYSWSLQDLQCSFMPPSQCTQLPGAVLLDHGRLVPLLQSIKSGCAARWSVLQGSGSWREACGVCFEEEQGWLLQLKPCKHVLCLSCVELLLGMVSSKPALCPFCRAAIAGVHVHLGEQGMGAEAQRPVVGDHDV